MDLRRIEQLSTRQREALRLYARRYRVKEIAAAMDISANTVSGYLTEAAALLDVGGRGAAAHALAAHEATHPDSRGRFSVGDEAPSPPPSIVPPGNPAPAAAAPVDQRSRWLPYRTGPGNDLSVALRFIWIAVIAVALVGGFGMFAFFVRTLSDLYARLLG